MQKTLLECTNRLLAAVPTDRLLLESGAPFLRGDGGKGVRDDLQQVVSALSQQLDLDADGVVQMIHENHLRLIG